MKKVVKIMLVLVMFLSFGLLIGSQSAQAAVYFNPDYYTQAIPENYYSTLDMTKSDEAFRRDLSAIISKGYKKHSYKENNTVLTYSDPDPAKNGNIICFYTGQSLSGGWNKEHVWAKSHGFPGQSTEPYCDAHHLRPTLISINSSRSNSDFGEVTGGKSDGFGNKWTNSVFEPRDEVKGDTARIMFYMATRYGFQAPFNLKLVNDTNTTTSDSGGRFGGLQTLLKWHYQDPVSKEEIYRNNVIYSNYQKNRNPYIDHPEYVDNAYPNQYSNVEPDQSKVSNVISLIAQIPAVNTITLADKDVITTASNAYNALNYAEKKLVTNYTLLNQALNKLNELNGNTDPIDPVDPDTPTESAVSINLNKVPNTGYLTNKNITIEGKSFFVSGYGVFSNQFRLGNKNNISIDEKYGIPNNRGALLEPLFDIENAKDLKVSIKAVYGNISGWYVLFKETGSNTYEQVAHQMEEPGSTITANLTSPKNGRFVVVVCGDTPRVDMSSYEVSTATKETIDYKDYAVETSIIATLEDNKLTSAAIRFGGRYDKNIFKDASSFGVIVMSKEELGTDTIESYYESGSITSFITEIDETGFKYVSNDFTTSKVTVDIDGNASENGDYYQFGLVVDNILGHEADNLSAVIYIEIDGTVYFFNETTTSFIDEVLYALEDAEEATDIAMLEAIIDLF